MLHQILAATVLFSGLILHYETNPTTHQKTAYLVDAPAHKKPRILVPVGDFDSASGLTHTAVRIGGRDFLKFEFPAGMHLVIVAENMAGKLKILSDFDDRVPHLKSILSAPSNEHADLKNGKNHNSHGTVSYANGTLDTTRCFEDAVVFDPHTTAPRCLAEEVRWSIQTTKNWEIREAGDPSNTIVLKAAAEVRIENEAIATGTHQKNYKLMLAKNVTVDDFVRSGKCNQGSCTVITAAEEENAKAHSAHDAPSDASSHAPRVECSNTQWP
jgi:hypothetical protein